MQVSRLIFETTWRQGAVVLLDKPSPSGEKFFNLEEGRAEKALKMIYPEDVPFWQIHMLKGKRTRITIEVLE